VWQRKPQLTFHVSVKPWLPPSDIPIWISFLDPESVRSLSLGEIGTLLEERAPMTWTSIQGAQTACKNILCSSVLTGLISIYYSILPPLTKLVGTELGTLKLIHS